MTFLPIVGRELQAAARHSFTYYLRVLGVAALLIASLLFGVDHGFGPNVGARLFGSLHETLFWAIWVFVPLLTADCLSRERREGTLGLLFLTRLKASDIVVAKSLAHGLRALTLWLAATPVLTIPFVLGGVGWLEAASSGLVNFSAICCALAAGLLASAWSKVWTRAVLRSAILAVLLLLVLCLGVGWRLLPTTPVIGPLTPAMGPFVRWQMSPYHMLQTGAAFVKNPAGAAFVKNPAGIWIPFAQFGPSNQLILTQPGPRVWMVASGQSVRVLFSAVRPGPLPRAGVPRQMLWGMVEVALLSLLVLVVAIWVAGAKTRSVWQEAPPSKRQLWWENTFCRPVLWLSFFRRWMRWKLERNPIGWLEQRSWSGRVVMWAWFAVIISIYSSLLANQNLFRRPEGVQELMAWLLAGSLALSAAGSFRRERESGVLELLLVSPLGESAIIGGRVRGLWSQFLPAFATLLFLWLYLSGFVPGFFDRNSDFAGPIWFFVSTFLTLPAIGLYFSLSCRNFITAFVATLAIGLAAPLWSWHLAYWLWRFWTGEPGHSAPWGQAILAQVVFAAVCWLLLNERLRKRSFPLERV